jgi:hypothetical protein
VIPTLLSFAVIIAYTAYNAYLNRTYGSIFLGHLLPASTLSEAVELIKRAFDNWGTHYFSLFHYLLVVLLLITCLVLYFKKRIHLTDSLRRLLQLTLVSFTGCCLFALLMLKQFPDHDYYFLDTFFLPLVLSVLFLIALIPAIRLSTSKAVYPLVLILVAAPLVLTGLNTQKNRRVTGSWDKTAALINNFEDADSFLNSLHIGYDAKILVVDVNVPNIPLILMNRKGYAIITTSAENIKTALNKRYDYIVIQDDYFTDTYKSYPEIVSRIEKIADNGKLSVCKLVNPPIKQDLFGFLGLSGKAPVLEALITFDTIADANWKNTTTATTYAYSGKNSGHLEPDKEYGLTYNATNIKALSVKSSTLLISAHFYREVDVNCEVVVTVSVNGQNVRYMSYNLKDLISKVNTWEKVDILAHLPKLEGESNELGVFLWNTGKSNLYMDDFSLKIY